MQTIRKQRAAQRASTPRGSNSEHPSAFLRYAQARYALPIEDAKQGQDLNESGLFRLKVLGKELSLSSETRNAKFGAKYKSTLTTTTKVVFVSFTTALQADKVRNSIGNTTS